MEISRDKSAYVSLADKEGTKDEAVVLKAGGGGKVDTSKTRIYCIDVQGWKDIEHTENENVTKKQQTIKTGKTEAEGEDKPYVSKLERQEKIGYFQYDSTTTHHTTNRLEFLTNIRRGKICCT